MWQSFNCKYSCFSILYAFFFQNNHVEFEAKMIYAFVAVAGYRGIHREVTTAGHTFVSDDDTRVRISVPKNSFSAPCITKFRVSEKA